MAKPTLIAAAVLAALATAPGALAQGSPADSAIATSLFREGRALLDAGRIAEACDKFDRSVATEKTVGGLLNIGGCREQMGATATAYGAYSEAVTLAGRLGDRERADLARQRMAALEPRLSRIRLELAGPSRGATFTRDGKEIPDAALGSDIPIDPGPHTLTALVGGTPVWSATITIGAQAGVTRVPVSALPDAPGFWTTQRIAGASVAGVGVAGVVVGSILGGIALGKANSLKSGGHCNADLTVCDATGLPMRQSAQVLAHGSTGALVAGGVVAAAGVVVMALPGRGAGGASTGLRRIVVGPVAGADRGGVGVWGGW